MQVFSPTARAPDACGFSATCAFANPGAGRGRLPRSTVSSVERFVDGSDLETSSREGWDWPAENVHTRNQAPRLAEIHKLSRPRVIPFPRVTQSPARNQCGEFPRDCFQSCGMCLPLLLRDSSSRKRRSGLSTTPLFPQKCPKGRTRRPWLLDMERSWKTIEEQRNEGISPCQQSKGRPWTRARLRSHPIVTTSQRSMTGQPRKYRRWRSS